MAKTGGRSVDSPKRASRFLCAIMAAVFYISVLPVNLSAAPPRGRFSVLTADSVVLNDNGSITTPNNGFIRIGTPDRESDDSFVAITGSFGDNTSGDNRALGITTLITTNPVTGNRSSEVINLRPSFTLPSSGNIATIEGLHIDFSGSWGPYGQLWNSGTSATVGSVHAIRVRGVTMPAGASTYSALTIDAGFGGTGATANYNIFSNGATARNRFDGILEVYGLSGHAIGNNGGPLPYAGLFISPTVTDNTGGVYGSVGVWVGPSVSPPATRVGYGLKVSPTIVEAGSGAHLVFATAQFEAPTVTPGAASVDFVSTIRLSSVATAGTYGNYSLWIDDGSVRWDDSVALGGGDNAVIGTIGGSGPTGAAQVGWLRVYVGTTASYIPYWQ